MALGFALKHRYFPARILKHLRKALDATILLFSHADAPSWRRTSSRRSSNVEY